MTSPLPSHLIVHTDGGSRGNPGPAAIGVVFSNTEHVVIDTIRKTIGVTTNNVAEYTALLTAFRYITSSPAPYPTKIQVMLDSELVVKQMRGEYKIKNEDLKQLKNEVQRCIATLPSLITFAHVYREANKIADALVNQALDEQPLR